MNDSREALRLHEVRHDAEQADLRALDRRVGELERQLAALHGTEVVCMWPEPLCGGCHSRWVCYCPEQVAAPRRQHRRSEADRLDERHRRTCRDQTCPINIKPLDE